MNKNFFILLSLSVILLSTLSAIFASGLYFINHQWWANFLMSFPVIAFIGYISNKFIEKRAEIIVESIKLERDRINSEQSVEVFCAYCKTPNQTQVKLGEKNTFVCKSCNQENGVLFQFGSTRVFAPTVLPEFGVMDEDMKAKILHAIPEQNGQPNTQPAA